MISFKDQVLILQVLIIYSTLYKVHTLSIQTNLKGQNVTQIRYPLQLQPFNVNESGGGMDVNVGLNRPRPCRHSRRCRNRHANRCRKNRCKNKQVGRRRICWFNFGCCIEDILPPPTTTPCPTEPPCTTPCPTKPPCTCPTKPPCTTPCPTKPPCTTPCPTRPPCPTKPPCTTPCPTRPPCPTKPPCTTPCPTKPPCTCPTKPPCTTPCPTTPCCCNVYKFEQNLFFLLLLANKNSCNVDVTTECPEKLATFEETTELYIYDGDGSWLTDPPGMNDSGDQPIIDDNSNSENDAETSDNNDYENESK